LPVPPEAGLLLSWKGWFGDKKLQIPIVDVAGEEVQRMIEKYAREMYPTRQTYMQLTQLIRYIQNSEGFILAVPAARALIFDDDERLELEPEDMQVDPDVNLARILESVFAYKEQSGGKRIKGIAVVITKWDLLMPYAKKKNMDIYDPTGAGLRNFMDVCFPATMMELKSYGMQNIRFFPSYINVAREPDGSRAKWEDGTHKIQLHPEKLRMPSYSEQDYVNLFEYLKSFAT